MIHMSQFRETYVRIDSEPHNLLNSKNFIFDGVEYN